MNGLMDSPSRALLWTGRILSGIAFALLAPHLFGGLSQLAVGPVGHCCAIVIGVVLGFYFQRAWHQRATVQRG